MCQEEVYKIIKELGGEAAHKEIKQRAKEKFPHLSLYQYVGDRLTKLKRKGYLTRMCDNEGNIVWKIVAELC